jgi:hypothetical protein
LKDPARTFVLSVHNADRRADDGDDASQHRPHQPDEMAIALRIEGGKPLIHIGVQFGQPAIHFRKNGERFALAAAPENETAVRQDTLIFIFNFFDELRRVAPATTR